MERLEDSFIPNLRPLFKTVISPFSNTIVVANKIRSKPYRKGYKTPAMPAKVVQMLFTGEYYWNSKGYLVDKKGDIVPSNPSKSGQPRLWTVNGQDLYNGKIKEFARASYMEKLEAYLVPYIEHQGEVTETNLKVQLKFYLIDKTKNKSRDNKMVDQDNLWIWQKSVRDLLKKHIVPDDNQTVFRAGEDSVDYVETEEETRLEILIWKR